MCLVTTKSANDKNNIPYSLWQKAKQDINNIIIANGCHQVIRPPYINMTGGSKSFCREARLQIEIWLLANLIHSVNMRCWHCELLGSLLSFGETHGSFSWANAGENSDVEGVVGIVRCSHDAMHCIEDFRSWNRNTMLSRLWIVSSHSKRLQRAHPFSIENTRSGICLTWDWDQW